MQLFAVAPPGLEALVGAELAELGHAGTMMQGGIDWIGSPADLRDANLWLRTASRILVRLGEFRARTFFELERHAGRLDWGSYVSRERRVALRVSARKSKLYHQGAIAERLHRAILEATGAVPIEPGDEESEGADAQLFVVRVLRDRFTISADSSGALLHRRGYRQEIARAPLRENLAAALLRATSWGAAEPLFDPFCGSGTIPIEAALGARRIPPGLAMPAREPRSFAFEQWPDHDAKAWRRQVDDARAAILPAAPIAIVGTDRDAGAIRAARANAERAGVADDIAFQVASLSAAEPPPGIGALVTNPPYGVRVSADAELRDLFATLGRYARDRLSGWRLALLSPDARLDAQLGLPLVPVAETRNGGIAVRILVARVP